MLLKGVLAAFIVKFSVTISKFTSWRENQKLRFSTQQAASAATK
jgi:hypothetical protein